MSIAVNTRHTVATSRTTRHQATAAAITAPPPVHEQLRDMRTLLRHFVLVLAAATAAIYAVAAFGLAI